MIASDVITPVRENLQDQDNANYRWTESELLAKLNDGIRDVRSRRPDLCFGASGEFPTFTDLSLSGGGALPSTAFDVDDSGRILLIDYVTYRALSRDGEDELNSKRAQEFLASYERRIANG